MQVKDLLAVFEALYPKKLAESWDNVGLMLGNLEQEVRKVILSLDITDAVIADAISFGADVIVTHHPFLFKPIKRVTTADQKGKQMILLMAHGISVISLHTNLDAAKGGVNDVLAQTLGLKNVRNIPPEKFDKLYKLCVFVPKSHLNPVRNAMSSAGAGNIGNYSHCTFSGEGMATFLPGKGTSPFIGKEGVLEEVEELRLETICKEQELSKVMTALRAVHPYEEPAYDIYALENHQEGYSFGKVGELSEPMDLKSFAEHLKKTLSIPYLRMIGHRDPIGKVAVFSGSFDGDLKLFHSSGADILVTGDIKYHTALDTEEAGYCIADCGHFNTEVMILNTLETVIKQHFTKVETLVSKVQKDPFVLY